MPFKLLCNCDKEKLNEVIDQVKKLSNTVDELSAEINLIKFCTSVISNESLPRTCGKYQEEKNTIGSGTLHKLKKCFEKNVTTIFSLDAGHRVKKKCQQLFSQSPKTFVPCPAHLSSRETPIYQHLSSQCTRNDKDSQIYESCAITESDRTKRTKARRKKSASSPTGKRRKSLSRDSKKIVSLPISLTSTSSLDQPNLCDKTLKKSSCSYESCNSLNSPAKYKNSSTRKTRIGKKKNTRIGTSDLMSPGTIEGCRKNSLKTVKRRRSVNFVDKKKCSISIEAKESSASSAILTSNTSVCDFQSCKIIHKEPKRNCRRKKNINIDSSEQKKSKSAQCSPNCLYLMRPKLCPRDVATNTYPDVCMKILRKVMREKRLMNQATQTSSKSDEYVENLCCNERKQFSPEPNRNCLAEGSLTSLTSQCSSRSLNNFCQEPEEFCKKLITQFDERDDEEKFEKRRKSEEREKKKDIVKKVKVLSCTQANNKIDERNLKPQIDSEEGFFKNRRKRTYVVCSDIGKTDEAIQHNFETKQKDFSSCGTDWRSYEQNGHISSCRKELKKPEAMCQFQEDHRERHLCEYCPKKYKNRYMQKTVCTNRPTKNYVSKFSPWLRKTTKRSRSKNRVALHQQVCVTSSSSQEFSDEPYSLISDSDLCEKSRINSIKYSRNKNGLQDERKICSSPDKNSRKYTVCGSLSGSVRSISSESQNEEKLTYKEME